MSIQHIHTIDCWASVEAHGMSEQGEDSEHEFQAQQMAKRKAEYLHNPFLLRMNELFLDRSIAAIYEFFKKTIAAASRHLIKPSQVQISLLISICRWDSTSLPYWAPYLL
jgi:hypothetical protein